MRSRIWKRWAREARPTATLALPIMSGMLGHMIMGLTDTVMVGRVGVLPLASAAFVNTLAQLPMVFAFGLLASIPVLASQRFGAGDRLGSGEVLRHGLLLALGCGVLAAAALAALSPVLEIFGQPPQVARASRTYLLLVATSLAPLMLIQAGKQFGESLNRPWPPTAILLGGVLLNILLNWVLIFGHWGAPAMGLNGAGWATLLARAATALAILADVWRAPLLRSFHPAAWTARLSGTRFRRLLELGWPVALQHALEVGAFAFAGLMMGWISAEAIAAHQIAITCAATTFMLSWSVGMAACIRVGHAWGAGLRSEARRIGWTALGMAFMLMGAFGLLFMMAGEPIARLFIAAPEVVSLAGRMLFLAALFQVADGLQVVAISALRGLMDVRIPALIAVLAYWVVAVPLGYTAAFLFNGGPLGIWIGLAVGLGTAAAGLVWRFHWLAPPPG